MIAWHTVSYLTMQYVMAFWAFWAIACTGALIACGLVRVQITNKHFKAVKLRNVYIVVHILLLSLTEGTLVIMVIISTFDVNMQRF